MLVEKDTTVLHLTRKEAYDLLLELKWAVDALHMRREPHMYMADRLVKKLEEDRCKK